MTDLTTVNSGDEIVLRRAIEVAQRSRAAGEHALRQHRTMRDVFGHAGFWNK